MQSPTKSCALDPIPTFLVKEMIDVLLPYVTAMINTSLREGGTTTVITQAACRRHPTAQEARTGRKKKN